MGKTYRKHESRLAETKKDPRRRSLKSHKQKRPNERTALRKEYR